MFEHPEASGWIRPNPGRQAILQVAKDYINEHLSDPIRVSEVASELSVTTRTLELVFRQLLGLNPSDYIKTARPM